MQPTTMILGFLPWIAFGIVAKLIGPESVAWSALPGVALVLAGAVLIREIRHPNQMSVGSLIPPTDPTIAHTPAAKGARAETVPFSGGASNRRPRLTLIMDHLVEHGPDRVRSCMIGG